MRIRRIPSPNGRRCPAAGRIAFVLLASFALSSIPAAAHAQAFDFSRHSVPLDQLIPGGPQKDGIPSIDHPRFVTARDAGSLADSDLVIGVESKAESRAYPIPVLTRHEVVNDRIGDLPLLVTYCPLTDSAVVFHRPPSGTDASFGVSGLLYQSNLLLFDRGTESLWSQLGAVAVTGPRLGQRLERFPFVVTSWLQWRHSHPVTTVLLEPLGAHRADPYAAYRESDSLMFLPSRIDTRLPLKERVLGVSVGGTARAYRLPPLKNHGGPLRATLDGHTFDIVHDGTEARVQSADPLVQSVSLYWFAWYAFHPGTSVWEREDQDKPADPTTTDLVRVESYKSYWTSIAGGGMDGASIHETRTPRGELFVISGVLRNEARWPLRSVRLAFELLDRDNESVYRQEGYNYGAESLMSPVDPQDIGSITPVPEGSTDRFRMLFLSSDLPVFDHVRVRVLSVEQAASSRSSSAIFADRGPVTNAISSRE